MNLTVELPAETLEEIVTEVTRRVVAELASATVPIASPYLTVAEAAELMRASRGRVYDLLSQRRLTRHKDGSRVLVAREEIHRYLAGEA